MRAVQKHHITYTPEETVYLYKGEHGIMTRIQWWERKSVSTGFIQCLERWIRENKDRAEDVTPR